MVWAERNGSHGKRERDKEGEKEHNERVVIVWDGVVDASGWLYCLCVSVYGRTRAAGRD